MIKIQGNAILQQVGVTAYDVEPGRSITQLQGKFIEFLWNKKLHTNFTWIFRAIMASISVRRCLDSSTESSRFISAWNCRWRADG
jgi:hypothetical protein